MPAKKAASRKATPVSVQGITPYLWFNDDAEEAAKFYVSLFKGSKILDISRYPEGAPMKAGTAMTVVFRIGDLELIALNGGPIFKFSPAFSLQVACRGQREVDVLWKALTRGGKESRCGWLEDRWGFSWQIIPTRLSELLTDPDPERAERAQAAMMTMSKIDVAKLERAARGN